MRVACKAYDRLRVPGFPGARALTPVGQTKAIQEEPVDLLNLSVQDSLTAGHPAVLGSDARIREMSDGTQPAAKLHLTNGTAFVITNISRQ